MATSKTYRHVVRILLRLIDKLLIFVSHPLILHLVSRLTHRNTIRCNLFYPSRHILRDLLFPSRIERRLYLYPQIVLEFLFDLITIARAIIQYPFYRRLHLRIHLKEFLHMRVKGLSVKGRCILYRTRIQRYPLTGKSKHACLVTPIHLPPGFYDCPRPIITQFPRMATPLLIFTTTHLGYS